MDGFSNKQLVGSLFCSFLSFLWGVVRSLDVLWGAGFTGDEFFRVTCFVAMLFGGILPALLTLKLKIHTDDYLKKRLITIAVVYVATGFIGMIGVPIVDFILRMIVYVGAIVFQVVEVQDADNSGGERFVMILSDPIVYWMIYWFLFWYLRGFQLM